MIITEKKKARLIESSHGEVSIKMAFINDKGETITPFVKCKDYFNDMFWSNKTGNKVTIYGFNWTPNQDEGVLSKDTLRVAIKKVVTRDLDGNGENKIIKLTEDNVKSLDAFFKQVQKKLKFKKTKFSLCENNDHIIIELDKKWTEIPYINSAFFLFVRIGLTFDPSSTIMEFYKDKNQKKFTSSLDYGYFYNVTNRIQHILDGKIDESQNYDQYTHGNIHSGSGIVGYSNYKIK